MQVISAPDHAHERQFSHTRMRRLIHLPKRDVTPMGRATLEAMHGVMNLQDHFHLSLSFKQPTQEFCSFYSPDAPRSKSLKMRHYSARGLYFQLAKQIQAIVNFRELLSIAEVKSADLLYSMRRRNR